MALNVPMHRAVVDSAQQEAHSDTSSVFEYALSLLSSTDPDAEAEFERQQDEALQRRLEDFERQLQEKQAEVIRYTTKLTVSAQKNAGEPAVVGAAGVGVVGEGETQLVRNDRTKLPPAKLRASVPVCRAETSGKDGSGSRCCSRRSRDGTCAKPARCAFAGAFLIFALLMFALSLCQEPQDVETKVVRDDTASQLSPLKEISAPQSARAAKDKYRSLRSCRVVDPPLKKVKSTPSLCTFIIAPLGGSAVLASSLFGWLACRGAEDTEDVSGQTLQPRDCTRAGPDDEETAEETALPPAGALPLNPQATGCESAGSLNHGFEATSCGSHAPLPEVSGSSSREKTFRRVLLPRSVQGELADAERRSREWEVDRAGWAEWRGNGDTESVGLCPLMLAENSRRSVMLRPPQSANSWSEDTLDVSAHTTATGADDEEIRAIEEELTIKLPPRAQPPARCRRSCGGGEPAAATCERVAACRRSMSEWQSALAA